MGDIGEQRVVARDGVDLHTWVSGPKRGTPVVFTHGVSMDHGMWDPQVEALSGTCRVITYDMRGHGLSKCPATRFSSGAATADLVAVLETHEAPKAVLVGHSFGGTVSQLLALERPEMVCGFIGVGCACVTLRPSLSMRIFSWLGPRMAARMGPERMRVDTEKRAGVTEQTRAYARRAMGALDDAMFEASVTVGFGDYRAIPGYHLGRPLLLLQGRQDGYRLLLSSARRWAKRDGGEYVLVPDAAHNAGLDNPQFVNSRMLAFMAGLGAASECEQARREQTGGL